MKLGTKGNRLDIDFQNFQTLALQVLEQAAVGGCQFTSGWNKNDVSEVDFLKRTCRDLSQLVQATQARSRTAAELAPSHVSAASARNTEVRQAQETRSAWLKSVQDSIQEEQAKQPGVDLGAQYQEDQKQQQKANYTAKYGVSEAQIQKNKTDDIARAKLTEAQQGQLPKVLSKIDPQYTSEAKAARIGGTVKLLLDVGADGVAHNIKVVQALDPGLDTNAIDALNKWRFQPAMKNGQPITSAAKVEMNFRLGADAEFEANQAKTQLRQVQLEKRRLNEQTLAQQQAQIQTKCPVRGETMKMKPADAKRCNAEYEAKDEPEVQAMQARFAATSYGKRLYEAYIYRFKQGRTYKHTTTLTSEKEMVDKGIQAGGRCFVNTLAVEPIDKDHQEIFDIMSCMLLGENVENHLVGTMAYHASDSCESAVEKSVFLENQRRYPK